MENAPSRLLIIDTAWLGDVVFTTALIGAVKSEWPGAEVHILVAPRGEPIVRHHPFLDRVWVYDKRGAERSLGSMRELSRTLANQRFDIILNTHPSFRSRLLTRLIGAPIRIGYEGIWSRSCFTHVVRNDLAVQPDHVERRINLLRVLRHQAKAELIRVGLDPKAVKWSDAFLREKGDRGTTVLGLVCGSAWETKRWNRRNFSELANRWEGTVLVFGGKSETQDLDFISENSKAIPIIQEPLPRVAALLARCDVVVGNDTGVTFLAVAAGCPKVIVLYGSTQVNYTFHPPHRAITAGVPCCLPRTGHGAQKCKWEDEPWCMKQISPGKVMSEIT